MVAAGLLSALLLIAAAAASAETRVYRCTGADGGIELRERPCPAGTAGEEVVVEDRKTGWDPSATGKGAKPKGAGRAPKSKRKPRGRAGSAAVDRTKEQCLKKREQLDEVNWRLRRGYKPSKGVELRHKRRAYEDFIRDHCP